MKRILLLLLLLAVLPCSIHAEDYLQMVSYEGTMGGKAVFVSKGVAAKKADVQANAAKSVFYTLFYQGVAGVADGKGLITKENKLYTNSFFNSSARYTFYVADIQEADKAKKVGTQYQGQYRVGIYLDRLLRDLETNKVYTSGARFERGEASVMPTIMVVPYKRDGESYSSILQSDFDRRVAVGKVQDGFNQRHITTIDLQGKLDAVRRRAAYEENSGAAESNDKQLLLTSGANVYVTVDVHKDINPAQGSRVALIMKAYETSTGRVLASKDATPVNRYKTTATDALCAYAVKDNLSAFLDDICRALEQTSGVVIQFAIDGGSSTTFNDRFGPKKYALRDILRQWVRKNAHKGQFHLQGITDEAMIFDSVKLPPVDADGLPMDAAQFTFMLESYLKDEQGVDCTTRVDGDNILVTIM